ncbi:MAG TPA: hypothetical protein VG755_06685 [Nannocystaceae bacterium]|nr:hypothetical protein [Nannocystaceae bacterium]
MPSLAEAAPPPVDASSKIPPEGIGLIVGGAMAVGGGIALAGIGFSKCSPTDLLCDEAERRKWGYAGIGITAAGVGLTAAGGVVKQRFNLWRDEQKLRVPKRGNGLFVGGGTLLGFAGLAWGATADGSKRAAIVATIWTLGGAGMIAGGAVMRVRYRKWKQQRFDYALAPMSLPRGGGVAISGRF